MFRILFRDLRGKKEQRDERDENTYDFIIFTLMHIHRGTTYVPLAIEPRVRMSVKRTRAQTSLHDTATGGINYLSSRTISPRSREVFLSEKKRRFRAVVKSNFVHDASAVFVSSVFSHT